MTQQEPFLVIELGTYALKVATCTKKKKEFVVTDARIIPFEKNFEEENFVELVRGALIKLSSYESFNKRRFSSYITISNHFVDYKTIKFNEGEGTQEKTKIEEQIELIYPVMGKKYLSNYHLFPRADTKNILSYHIKKSLIEKIYSIFKEYNFLVKHIEFNSISLYNLYLNLFSDSKNYSSLEPKMDIIVSLGESEVELIFIRPDFVSFEKLIGFSFKNLTQNIKDNMNEKSDFRVHERKQSCNNSIREGKENDQDKYIKQALEKSIIELKLSLTEQVNIFLSQNNISSVNNIYLTGGNSYLVGIEEVFEGVNAENISILNSIKNKTNIHIAPYLQEYDFLICMPSLQGLFGVISQFVGNKESVALNIAPKTFVKSKVKEFKVIRNIAILIGLLLLLFIYFPTKQLSMSFQELEKDTQSIYELNNSLREEYKKKIKLDDYFKKISRSIINNNEYIDFLKNNLKEEKNFFVKSLEKKNGKEKISGFLLTQFPNLNIKKMLHKKYIDKKYIISFVKGKNIENLYEFEGVSKK